MAVRLQKFIASTGLASRRKAEELMSAGRVSVNGAVVKKLGTTIDPSQDGVCVDGKLLKAVSVFRYIVLNKPVGITCTRAQHKNEKTVFDLVPGSRDLVIAGRIDKDSDGLILLTNDGELTNKLTHPRYGHEKEYEIVTVKPLDPQARQSLLNGIELEEGRAKFDRLEAITDTRFRVILHQGWKRQIRRLIGHVHNDVVALTRVRINKMTLGNLKTGEWRQVQLSEII